MTENAQKTPCSLLQELCLTNDLEPEYRLISVEGAVHAPTFTYEARVKEITSIASGNSKKKAKHAAAKIVLAQLLSKEGEFKEGFVSEGVMVNAETLNDIVVEAPPAPPIEETNVKNAIGMLQELCMKKEWAAPYYETLKDEGLPHDKVFTLSCEILHAPKKFVTYGEAKSKRIAKRVAAEKMVEKLLEMKIVTQPDFDEKKRKPEGYLDNTTENLYEAQEELDETSDALSSLSMADCGFKLEAAEHSKLTSTKNQQDELEIDSETAVSTSNDVV